MHAMDKFIKEHSEILITRTDKDNVTVAMHKEDYSSKMTEILARPVPYQIVDYNPTKKLFSEL